MILFYILLKATQTKLVCRLISVWSAEERVGVFRVRLVGGEGAVRICQRAESSCYFRPCQRAASSPSL